MIIRKYRKARHEAREREVGRQLVGIQKSFLERHGRVVQGGPFRGMHYVESSTGSSLMPKFVGSYEAEIHAALERYCTPDRPVRIVDIGCDEGYYAVGMALRMPSAIVYGFDINPAAVKMCRHLAELNGVQERVIVEGECTSQRLQELLRPGDLVICDCEGCEHMLLDPEKTPALKKAHLIVETHDSEYIHLDITPTLVRRFEATHEVELHTTSRRRPEVWPQVEFLDREQRAVAVDEGRVLGQQWACLWAKP